MARRASLLDVPRPGVDDMTLLTKGDEKGITANLSERLKAKSIYTYIGQVLVVMNPFTWLDIYSEAAAKRYARVSRLDVAPHIFAIAEAAYRAMTEEEESQCIIISGESGAGRVPSVQAISMPQMKWNVRAERRKHPRLSRIIWRWRRRVTRPRWTG